MQGISNVHAVGATPKGTIYIALPPRQLSPDEALIFAGWIVTLAETKATFTFAEALAAIQNS